MREMGDMLFCHGHRVMLCIVWSGLGLGQISVMYGSSQAVDPDTRNQLSQNVQSNLS